MQTKSVKELNVTVADLVKARHRRVKLGAADGCGFIYCGDIASIGKSNVEKEIYGRQLIDVYPSIDEKGVFIVLFDGDEKGKYWTTEEYVSGCVGSAKSGRKRRKEIENV